VPHLASYFAAINARAVNGLNTAYACRIVHDIKL